MTFYTIGWNMPGYLPEMEPYAVAECDDARTAMLEELNRHADQESECDNPVELDLIQHAIGNLVSTAPEDTARNGWGYFTDQLHYWIDIQPGPMPKEEA